MTGAVSRPNLRSLELHGSSWRLAASRKVVAACDLSDHVLEHRRALPASSTRTCGSRQLEGRRRHGPELREASGQRLQIRSSQHRRRLDAATRRHTRRSFHTRTHRLPSMSSDSPSESGEDVIDAVT
eukprot:CAMPEP_0202831036 /NCGR_PEP_ID=MMETSP1389-20130828/16572_1 /ASSEMBLY_ACC=CAM_ASM_000865 /TAXON_ID=302021 /ORGANISM="Rhodomonas sp., Strain CCMP768" /LENGTH=126 /DNA_ID=CAMNT_0049504725 /DNA_START=217 /DNA_END=597 /DNA_ORIENTATION=-